MRNARGGRVIASTPAAASAPGLSLPTLPDRALRKVASKALALHTL